MTARTPAEGATGVAARPGDGDVQRVVGPTGITFELRGAGRGPGDGDVNYDGQPHRHPDPSAPLAASTTTNSGATVPRVKDAAGNTMAPATWSFTTVRRDTSPPTVTAVAGGGATGRCAVGSRTVAATFSEALQRHRRR